MSILFQEKISVDLNLFLKTRMLSNNVFRPIFFSWEFLLKRFLGIFLTIVLLNLIVGCSQKRGIADRPKQQFYQDITERYLPAGKVSFCNILIKLLLWSIGNSTFLRTTNY
jgi:ATP sulfurylase